MGDRASNGRTAVERRSELELVVTRTFNGPVRLVFDAWTKPELFKLWWAPKSMGVPILSCEMDVRTGGSYRITFGHDASDAMLLLRLADDIIDTVELGDVADDRPQARQGFGERRARRLRAHSADHPVARLKRRRRNGQPEAGIRSGDEEGLS